MKTPSEADLLLAYRYMYYCLGDTVISDQEYDRREKEWTDLNPDDHDLHHPGSSLESDYSEKVKALARKLIRDNR